jgi:HEPN domain-containing protein
MHNADLIEDYITRSGHRLEAVKLLFARESYADVVRESQEIIELCLKALLRFVRIDPPRSHDVSEIILENKSRLPKNIASEAEKLASISHSMRRDRELSFYGSEDLTPGHFYKKMDGQTALQAADYVYTTCRKILK